VVTPGGTQAKVIILGLFDLLGEHHALLPQRGHLEVHTQPHVLTLLNQVKFTSFLIL
jgi:hypothetical protein